MALKNGARQELHRAGLIHNPYYYDFAQILAGDDFVPKAGEFLIPARASLAETLNIIDQGRSHQRRLTVIEGTRVAAVIEALGMKAVLRVWKSFWRPNIPAKSIIRVFVHALRNDLASQGHG